MIETGTRTWFSADELSSLALPGLPRQKRKVNERARADGWALACADDGAPLARPREGRGGGLEYHISLFPAAARAELVRRGIALDCTLHRDEERTSQLWSWYERQSAKTKAEAERRLAAVREIDQCEATGMTRSAAVASVAANGDVSSATLWNWLKLIAGIAREDRLPCLAPRRRGGGAKADIHPKVWQYFVSDYLRPEKPTLASCYARAEQVAAIENIPVPHIKTFQRRLEAEIDPRLVIAKRDGAEALRRSIPSQQRSVAELHALEAVNIDGHKFDVFVDFGEGRIARPIMVAIQDIYSRKLLSWRIGLSESAVETRLAFADLFRNFGIPKHCVLDNGRAFASKWISGGAKSRFRFKIKDEEPTGVLTALGIGIHWAMPYRGQSKPIERGFRDLCDSVARHPAMAGAYTGNKPDAKPENYGSKAIPLYEFRRHVAAGIAAHNARQGRRTETANGRSFDAAFAESYARAPIGKATPEQLRLALLSAEQKRIDRRTGEIRFAGNRYWSSELSGHHGQQVTLRFDPDDLHQPIHVYDLAGAYLASAELIEASGFFDIAGAKKRARQEADLRRRARELEDAEQLLTAEKLAEMLPDYGEADELPEPEVVRPVRHRGQTAAALKPKPQQDNFMDQFSTAVTKLRLVD